MLVLTLRHGVIQPFENLSVKSSINYPSLVSWFAKGEKERLVKVPFSRYEYNTGLGFSARGLYYDPRENDFRRSIIRL